MGTYTMCPLLGARYSEINHIDHLPTLQDMLPYEHGTRPVKGLDLLTSTQGSSCISRQYTRESEAVHHLSSVTAEFLRNGHYINQKSVIGGQTSVERKIYQPDYQINPQVNKPICAFGPRHAEHARKLYEFASQGIQRNKECSYNFVAPDRFNIHVGKQVPDSINGGKILPPLVLVAPNPKFRKSEPVFRIATICPRPSKMSVKTKMLASPSVEPSKYKQQELKKSLDFPESECDKDLSSAPIFQILCELW